VGLERLVGRVDPHLEAGDAARGALGLRQPRPVQRQEQHRLDQPVDVEVLVRVVGVREAEPVDELGDDVLDLDAGVHLHEEVVEALDDVLEGRDAVEPRRLAEARALGLHALEGALVAPEHLGGGACRHCDLDVEQLLGERYLEQLLLVHLHRAIPAPHGDAPLAVADQLDLVVARALDVELDQEVPVGAGGEHLDLGEDVHHRGGDLFGLRHHALSLAAASAHVLEADAVARILAPDGAALLLGPALELLDRDELDPVRVARLEQRLRVLLLGERRVEADLEPVLASQLLEGLPVRCAAREDPGRHIVHARDHGVAEPAGQLLGLVLRSGAADHPGRGTDEAETRRLDRLHELGVLGHEAVAGEDVGVPVGDGDLDDLPDAQLLLLLPGPHVVGYAVHVAREAQAAQLGRQAARVGDRVLLGQQHAVLADADLVEDLEGLHPHGSAADDQTLHGVEREGAQPGRIALVEARGLQIPIQHYSNSLWGPAMGAGV
jgi:hypothetical protein